MMKIVEINSCNNGSTGNIALQIGSLVENQGGSFVLFCPMSRTNMKKHDSHQRFIGNRLINNEHLLLGRLTGLGGCFSILSTSIMLREVTKLSPDIIHLHNLHNSYINLNLLFRYLKKYDIPVVWTLHDCWSFTGRCPYFTILKCNKWQNGCYDCPYGKKQYPQVSIDKTKVMWKLKKKWFIGVKNLTIVTPSEWLADLVRKSYLKNYSVKVVNNGIDLSIFKPIVSNFKEKYGIPKNKFILLGVAFGWEKRKGLDVFIDLANRLDREKYQIVLVGTDDSVDHLLPNIIISIHRTYNQIGLAEIYSSSDLFVNPTREENYPTVNMEALACGTPVITFKTGGSPEIIDPTCGSVVECDDVDALEKEIIYRCEIDPFNREACLKRAEAFDMHKRFIEYTKLYDDIVNEKR